MSDPTAHGIGSAIVAALAHDGACREVWAIDRSFEAARATAASVSSDLKSSSQTAVVPYRCDVTNAAEVESMVAVIASRGGRIEGLVNVVGIVQPTGLLDTTFDAWRHVMSVNLDSAFLVTQAVVRHMVHSTKAIELTNLCYRVLRSDSSCSLEDLFVPRRVKIM